MMRPSHAVFIVLIALAVALPGVIGFSGPGYGGAPNADEHPSAPAIAGTSGGLPTLSPILKRTSPAVVNISVDTTEKTVENPFFQDPFFRKFFNLPDQVEPQHVHAVGSGVIFDADKGYVVTNNHVVDNADKIKVTLADGREFDAKLLGKDAQTDLAVLKIDARHLTSLPIGNSDALRVGDYVIAIGNPFGVGQTATFGIVSALGRSGLGIEGYEDFIQTDASINPGNSGGALLDLGGRLVGINTAILSQSGGNVGIGFAIPVSMAKGIISQLISHGKVTRGELGVVIQDMTPAIADAMGTKTHTGALVSKVMEKSPAQEAGLKPGDVITMLDGHPVRNASQLRNEIGAMQPGTKIRLSVLRKGETRNLTAKLERLEEAKSITVPKSSPLSGLALGPIPPGDPSYGKIKGVFVSSVQSGSRAEEAGIQKGDIIVSANNKAVETPKDLVKIVERNGKKPLLLNIQRGDGALFIVIR